MNKDLKNLNEFTWSDLQGSFKLYCFQQYYKIYNGKEHLCSFEQFVEKMERNEEVRKRNT